MMDLSPATISVFLALPDDFPLLGFTGLQHALDLPLWPAKVVVWMLFMMSILCWTIIASKLVSTFRSKKRDITFTKALNVGDNPLSLYAARGDEDEFSLRAHVYRSTAREMTYQLLGSSEIDETLAARIGRADKVSPHQFTHVREASKSGLLSADVRMRTGFGLLASATFVAPMIGLLGASWLFMNGYEGVVERTLNTINPELAAAAMAVVVVGLCVAIPAAAARIIFSIKSRERRHAINEFSNELCKAFDRNFVQNDVVVPESAAAVESEVPTPTVASQEVSLKPIKKSAPETQTPKMEQAEIPLASAAALFSSEVKAPATAEANSLPPEEENEVISEEAAADSTVFEMDELDEPATESAEQGQDLAPQETAAIDLTLNPVEPFVPKGYEVEEEVVSPFELVEDEQEFEVEQTATQPHHQPVLAPSLGEMDDEEDNFEHEPPINPIARQVVAHQAAE